MRRADLPEPFQAENANFGAGREEGQGDVLEDLVLRGTTLPNPVHTVDKLSLCRDLLIGSDKAGPDRGSFHAGSWIAARLSPTGRYRAKICLGICSGSRVWHVWQSKPHFLQVSSLITNNKNRYTAAAGIASRPQKGWRPGGRRFYWSLCRACAADLPR